MLANHTAIAGLFDRCVKQYDKLRSRNAFLENYRQESMFSDNLDEFDQSREAVLAVSEEYRAAETEEYVNWGGPGTSGAAGSSAGGLGVGGGEGAAGGLGGGYEGDPRVR